MWSEKERAPSEATEGANPANEVSNRKRGERFANIVDSGYIQSLAQNPAARPLAHRNSSGLLSTTHIVSGLVRPLSDKKYAAQSPMMPEPSTTVCDSFGPGVGVGLGFEVGDVAEVVDVDVAPFGT